MNCLCGCGLQLPHTTSSRCRSFIYGHKLKLSHKIGVNAVTRLVTNFKSNKPRIKKHQRCRCGCGKRSPLLIRHNKDGLTTKFYPAFVPGHQFHNVKIDVQEVYACRGCLRGPVTKVYGKACIICGWNEATTDIHHLISKETVNSVVILCPNCHRKANEGILHKRILRKKQKELITNYRKLYSHLS